MESHHTHHLQKNKPLFRFRAKPHSHFVKLEVLHHQRRSGVYIADLVFGAYDGIITIFSVIAGAQGAALSRGVILVLGFANLVADGIAMGFGNYLGSKSELDYQKLQRLKETFEIEQSPEKEKHEIREIFEQKGFTGTDLDRIVEIITSDKERWIDMMMIEELNIIENANGTPLKRGAVTFTAFVTAGLIPILPFFLPFAPESRFTIATISTAAALFIAGALRSMVTVRHWLRSGLEMLAVGFIAAAAAYYIGTILHSATEI